MMIKRERKPTPPGEILKELYLKERGISIAEFARAIGCSRKHMSQIINDKARIEPEMAAKIAAVLGTTPRLWMNLQNTTDLYKAEQKLKTWKPRKIFHANTAQ